ncbi:hypothetical protein Pve01_78970 [Planomonospora venezuelensis]|nr:hypothetical protein Pve01_78970 [Planomonospora venezuelensis]
MTDAPTWYDVLDVPHDAPTEDVRAAWKGRIADLEPGDRRFDTLNRAAKVLLDPVARAAYDETLPAQRVEPLVEEDTPASPPLVEEGARRPSRDHDCGGPRQPFSQAVPSLSRSRLRWFCQYTWTASFVVAGRE